MTRSISTIATLFAATLAVPAFAGMSSSALVADMAPGLTVERIARSSTPLQVATLSDRTLGDISVLCSGPSGGIACSVTASRAPGVRATDTTVTSSGGLSVGITDGRDRDWISIEPNPSP